MAKRVVVIGATGNVGTSLLHALESDDSVEHVIGIARRRPRLAWLIQPTRDRRALRATNVGGSRPQPTPAI